MPRSYIPQVLKRDRPSEDAGSTTSPEYSVSLGVLPRTTTLQQIVDGLEPAAGSGPSNQRPDLGRSVAGSAMVSLAAPGGGEFRVLATARGWTPRAEVRTGGGPGCTFAGANPGAGGSRANRTMFTPYDLECNIRAANPGGLSAVAASAVATAQEEQGGRRQQSASSLKSQQLRALQKEIQSLRAGVRDAVNPTIVSDSDHFTEHVLDVDLLLLEIGVLSGASAVDETLTAELLPVCCTAASLALLDAGSACEMTVVDDVVVGCARVQENGSTVTVCTVPRHEKVCLFRGAVSEESTSGVLHFRNALESGRAQCRELHRDIMKQVGGSAWVAHSDEDSSTDAGARADASPTVKRSKPGVDA